MNGVRNRFSSVKGITDVLRIPRLGKIRLGLRVLNDAQTSQYPKETKYFVCPPEVEAVYGKTPTELDVIFPLDSEAEAFPQAYKWYAGPSLRCKGDGQAALRIAGYLGKQAELVKGTPPADPSEMAEITCPCPLLDKDKNGKAACNLVGTLSYMLPRVSIAGVYQTDIRSYNSILNLNSGLALARRMAGQISMIPFKLKRVPQEIQYKGKTNTHYILRLEHQLNLAQIKSIRGDQFMLGLEGKKPVARLIPADAVQDLAPGKKETYDDLIAMDIRKIEIIISDVLCPEDGIRDDYIICGHEVVDDPEEVPPEVKFHTIDIIHAKLAWELTKAGDAAEVEFLVLKDGSFEIFNMTGSFI